MQDLGLGVDLVGELCGKSLAGLMLPLVNLRAGSGGGPSWARLLYLVMHMRAKIDVDQLG